VDYRSNGNDTEELQNFVKSLFIQMGEEADMNFLSTDGVEKGPHLRQASMLQGGGTLPHQK